jgi:hypothetical protein
VGKLSNSTEASQVHRSDGRPSQILSPPTQARTQSRAPAIAHVHQKNPRWASYVICSNFVSKSLVLM